MTHAQILYRKATPADFEGILLLQHQNLLTSLTGEDLAQGYLSIEFTREQLHKDRGGPVCLDSLKQFLSDKLLRLMPLPAS